MSNENLVTPLNQKDIEKYKFITFQHEHIRNKLKFDYKYTYDI